MTPLVECPDCSGDGKHRGMPGAPCATCHGAEVIPSALRETLLALALEDSALAIARRINANTYAFWDGERSYEEFSAEQLTLWRRAERKGIAREVSALLPVNQRN